MTVPAIGGHPSARRPVRIANCSGFYGDRLSAAAEVIGPEPVDVLTGDWLAELTMSILAKDRARGGGGFARTFLRQLEDVLGPCHDAGVRIVANAGGVAPHHCAEQVLVLGQQLGLPLSVAVVDGDDLTGRIAELRAAGERLAHLDTDEPWDGDPATVLAANAYLGGHAISAGLRAGAEVVVTGRVADAAVVSGAAAWWYDWDPSAFDELAGATAAGHVIECGAQATGGNYAAFTSVRDLTRPGFPIAEIAADGSSVITKQPGTGGEVSVGTVTAQLLYEVAGPRYHVPDVIVRLDTVRLEQAGPDRVRLSGTRGEPAPDHAKVLLTYPGGYRNSMTIAMTGLNRAAKAELAQRAVWDQVPGGEAAYAETRAEIIGAPVSDDGPDGQSYLRLSVADPDRQLVGRRFSAAVVATGLASFPGFYMTTPPTDAAEFLVGWPTLVPADAVSARVRLTGRDGDRELTVPAAAGAAGHGDQPAAASGPDDGSAAAGSNGAAGYDSADGPFVPGPIGTLAGGRSGDKGGNANVGLWVTDARAYPWLLRLAQPDVITRLLPETQGLELRCYPLPNLLAVNIVVIGLLGRGVAASLREDPQAKALAERLRAVIVPLPAALVPAELIPDGHSPEPATGDGKRR